MAKKSVTSKKYRLNLQDGIKAFFISVGTSVAVVIQKTIDSGVLVFNWKQIGMIAVGAGLTYLIKNFFTPATVQTPVSDEKAEELSETLPQASKP